MTRISKRFLDRARPALRKYQKLLAAARTRDVNESDTCVIVSDFLQDVLGYDKYAEVTTEFAVRSTFCDLAIKSGSRVQYLIEVKPVGTDLKDNHVRQATDYAANHGVDWVLLTNGAQWHAYKLRFEKPIQHEEVFVIDLLANEQRPTEQLEKLYLISREAGGDSALASYWQGKEATSRYVIAQLMASEVVVGVLRRELRRLFKGVRVERKQLEELICSEVLKRECLEGDRADAAVRLVRRGERRRAKRASAAEVVTTPPAPNGVALPRQQLPA